MVKLYYPPSALLTRGNQQFVELAGAKCLLAINDEKELIVISNIFSELSWGEFWKEVSISDQIENIIIKHEDSAAIYDTAVLADKIISSLRKIIASGLIFFGVASFEGNAFETTVFDEMDLSREDSDRLLNLYKATRLRDAFPDIKKGQYVEMNFFGKAAKYFSFAEQKNFQEIAAAIYPHEGNASGIVAVAQGAANFILLTHNLGEKQKVSRTTVDKTNLNQMFHLLKKGVLAAPISWFSIDMGLKGLEELDGWDEIKDLSDIHQIQTEYSTYLKDMINKTEKKSLNQILDDDLGKPIDVRQLDEETIQNDFDQIMDTINILNELQTTGKEIRYLYNPPKILFAYGDGKKTAIGGATILLSTDVGKNLRCIGNLHEDITWGEVFLDESSSNLDESTFGDLGKMEFTEIEDPNQYKEILIQDFQKIIKNNQLFFGTFEIESNGFEFCLFPELDINDKSLENIRQYYKSKIKSGKFPKLEEGSILINWKGPGKEYFTNPECVGIYDLASKMETDDAFKTGEAYGVVCADSNAAYFYIISGSLTSRFSSTLFPAIDILHDLFEACENTELAPVAWFKFSLGLSTIEKNRLWKEIGSDSAILETLKQYKKYTENLIHIKSKEELHRLYD